MFKDCGLSITTECNNKSLYINKPSNHPPNILKKLAKSIEKSLPETSSNSDVSNRSIEIYKNAL